VTMSTTARQPHVSRCGLHATRLGGAALCTRSRLVQCLYLLRQLDGSLPHHLRDEGSPPRFRQRLDFRPRHRPRDVLHTAGDAAPGVSGRRLNGGPWMALAKGGGGGMHMAAVQRAELTLPLHRWRRGWGSLTV
jgi:hypothetical protein